MTTLHNSGTTTFMGAGLVCRVTGDYIVEDVTAKILLANEPELFRLAEEQSEEPEVADGEPAEVITEEPGANSNEIEEEFTETEQGTVDDASSEARQADALKPSQETFEPAAPTKPLSKMNKSELEALAAELSVVVDAEAMTVEQMREAIKTSSK